MEGMHSMYNHEIALEIINVALFSSKEKDTNVTGATITGIIKTEKTDYLSDLDFGTKVDKKGLNQILAGVLPIDGDVKLLFSQRPGLQAKFGEHKPEACTIAVRTGNLDEGGLLRIQLKIKLKKIPGGLAGDLVENLKDVVTLRLIQKQEELQLRTGKKNADQGAK